MAEYVMDYDGWAEGMPIGAYLKVRDVMHERRREHIVRCRDCKHYSDHEWVLVTDVSDVCHFFGDGVRVEPDGFCKWGEPREVDGWPTRLSPTWDGASPRRSR